MFCGSEARESRARMIYVCRWLRGQRYDKIACPRMIDLHSHILPGIDDGPKTLDESLELATAAVDDGIELVAATPHVRDDYPTPVATMERLVDELRVALQREHIPLELRTGGEIALERLDVLSTEELRRFGLAGNPRFLLLEFPYYGWPLQLGHRIIQLRRLGITAVLAHPERSLDVQAAPDRLRPFTDAGALIQITAASVEGRLGGAPRTAASRLIELGLAHLLASDAHAPSVRTVGMSVARRAIRDDVLASWLATDVPSAIVSDRPLPARPRQSPRWRIWR
jgi:protein-tyrosine phosphatase